MSVKKKTILFITYSFGHSGSEIMLLEFIKGLDREVFSPHLYSILSGDLLQELPKDVPYYLPYKLNKGFKNWIQRKSISKKGNNYLAHQLTAIQKKIMADAWYINTIAVNPYVYELAVKLKVKVITHIHELTSAYSFYPSNSIRNIIKYSNVCIGCSAAVCKNLSDIGIKDPVVQYNFIDTEQIILKLKKNPISRDYFNIKPNEFLWAVSARTTYFKGIDYLLDILNGLGDRKYKILWIGTSVDNALTYHIKTVIEKNHAGKVIFTGALTDKYYSHMNLADGFLIPSREESFSLVAVEAAFLGIPIVTFEYGAAKEVVTDETGNIVNSWNTSDLINEMTKLMDNTIPDKPRKKNHKLAFTKSHQIPKFNELLKNIT